MAYLARKINPLDLQPRKAIGVALPFSAGAVFNSTYQSKDAIKTNLVNLLLTSRGERVLNPLFGTNLREVLFEQITDTTIRRLDREIRNTISNYFPTISIKDLVIRSDPDYNTISLVMSYTVVDTNIEDEIIINFEA